MQERSTPLLRLLSDIKETLERIVKTVNEYQQSNDAQRKEKLETEFKTITRLPVEVTKYYESEERERPVSSRREARRFWLEVAGVGVAFILAVLTLFTLLALKGQLGQARRTNDDLERQFKQQQRPWVGISSPVTLPKQLVFLSFSGSKPYTGVELNTSLGTRNFGISPAFKVGSHIELLLTENTLKLPENEMTSACSAADKVGIGESVIFPNTEIAQGFEMQQNQPIALQQVQRLWAIGCVSYLDQISNETRHTRFWIASQMLQDNIKPSFIKSENRGGRMVDFFSLPVRGWLLLKIEAD